MNAQVQEVSNTSQKDGDIDLLQLIDTFLNGKWLILFFMLITTLLAFIYAFGQPATYRADALVQVEAKTAVVPGIEDLAGFGGDDTSIGAELELIKSRRILGQAVDALSLDIIAYPNKIPLLSHLHQRFFSPDNSHKFPAIWETFDKFTTQYAWGNENIKVSRLDVPDRFLNKPLTVIIKVNKSYQLFFKDNFILEGKIGQAAEAKESSLGLFIDDMNGLPETTYTLIKQSKLTAITNLQKHLHVKEKGKKTGIISLILEGSDKTRIVQTLNHISETYLQQNKSRSSEEASNALTFLNEQIKPVKEKLNEAEARLSQYRTQHKTADMSMETQSMLRVVAEIETELQQLSFRKDELSKKYTANHPSMQVVLSQEKKLEKRKKDTLINFSKLPKTQQELLKLTSDFTVTETIYLQLLNNTQEFKIVQASSVGNVYIVDRAIAYEEAVKPKKALILMLSVFLGLILGVLIVFLRKAFHQTIDNPEILEQILGLPVYATVPLSKEVKLTRAFKNKARKQKSLLALENITDPAIESLRSLRTSLHFALLEAKNNIVMITGPSPGIGKSFISSNFAAVLASGEQSILLIDADMRKGYLHNVLNLNISPGLSGLISNKHSLEETIKKVAVGSCSMDVITRGQTPPNPSELLMHSHFEELLNKLSRIYDLILIDTPPVHAVTDPTIIGAHAGVTFMVVRYNQHSMKEIEYSVSRLTQTGVETKGFIFNGYIAKNNRYGYGYPLYYDEYQSEK